MKFASIKNYIIHLINYFYYFNTSFIKNSYPLRIVGESLETPSLPMIKFKMLGKSDLYEIALDNILIDKSMIGLFSPEDAIKLGKLTFNNLILNLPSKDRIKKFLELKRILLNSNECVLINDNKLRQHSDDKIKKEFYTNLSFIYETLGKKNIYPCKIVEGDFTSNNSTVTYTIFDKKDGYKIKLAKLISNKSLLQKFHPAHIVTLAFITFGDFRLFMYDQSRDFL